MKVAAVKIRGAGGPEVLEIGEHELPELGPEQIRVRVVAAGLNRADLLQRKGRYPAPPGVPPDVPGLEYAGVVEACGARVADHPIGEAVMGITAGGAMAEAVVVHAREAIPVPKGLGPLQAAAIPEVFFTAWDALFRQADLRAGSLLLVHAAGSGIGTAAIQLARLTGASVVGTSRDEAKLAELEKLGLVLDAALVVDRDTPRFAEALREKAGRGADVILDGVGGGYLGENIAALEARGRVVVIGLLAGATGELPLSMLLQKRASIVGTVLRSRPLEEKIALARDFDHHTRAAFESNRLRPIIADVMPMKDIAEAHRRLEANDVVGKLVLSW
jgi:putative PIG3 family NAD(P)H quinone oxidoreductase